MSDEQKLAKVRAKKMRHKKKAHNGPRQTDVYYVTIREVSVDKIRAMMIKTNRNFSELVDMIIEAGLSGKKLAVTPKIPAYVRRAEEAQKRRLEKLGSKPKAKKIAAKPKKPIVKAVKDAPINAAPAPEQALPQ